jgi:hypothetical protein
MVVLRETQERIILIDAPGLDDGRDVKADETIMMQLMQKLSGIKNILCVLILIKRGEIIGASLKRVLSDYKKMINSKNEKELFCAVLTHCDPNINF